MHRIVTSGWPNLWTLLTLVLALGVAPFSLGTPGSFHPDLPAIEVSALIQDDPVAVSNAAAAYLKVHDQRDLAWARVVVAHLFASSEIDEPNPRYFSQTVLSELQSIVKSSDDRWLQHLAFILQQRYQSNQDTASTQDLETWLQIAEKRAEAAGRGRFLADTYREFANFFNYKRDKKRSLELDRKALMLIMQDPSPKDYLQALIKNDVAILLYELKDDQKAIELYKEVLVITRAAGLRYLSSVVMHNLAKIYEKSSSPQDLALAKELFLESKDFAQSIHNELLEAYNNLGMANIENSAGEGKRALAYLSDAEILFIKSMAPSESLNIMRGDVEDCRAVAYMHLKNWVLARKSSDKALSFYPETMLSERMRILEHRAEILHQMGLPELAFLDQKAYLKIHKEKTEKETQQNLNRLQVNLGLEVEEQKNKLLVRENELQAQTIREARLLRTFALFGFAVCLLIIILLLGLWLQAHAVKKARQKMKDVLDHIEEGILTIGPGLTVDSSFSPYLANILHLTETDLGRRDLFLILLQKSDLSQDEQITLRAALDASIGEDRLSWELNEGQFPLHLTLDQKARSISLHWQALLNKHGRVQNILLTLRDNTERLKLEQQLNAANQQSDMIMIRLRDMLETDLRRVKDLCEELSAAESLIDRLQVGKVDGQDSLLLHTWKGISRSLGLRDLAASIHVVEDFCKQPVRDGSGTDAIESLRREIKIHRDLMQRLAHLHSDAAPTHRAFNLHEIVGAMLPELRQRLADAQHPLASIAVVDEIQHWNLELSQAASLFMNHGLSNCVDHGYIRPLSKGLAVQSPRLTVLSGQENGRWQLIIRDNGIGLDLPHIKQMAIDRGFQPEAGQNWTDVLFWDGVTTAVQANLSSGRGVGLAAIADLAKKLNGRVSLTALPSHGAELKLVWPVA